MRRALAATAVAAAVTTLVAPVASASSPHELTAVAYCDGYEPIETTVRNAKAVFFNENRQAPVGVTVTSSEGSGPRVGVVFADVVDNTERTLRGQKAYDERGFTTTRCDIVVFDFPFGGGVIPELWFSDVQVKLAPDR